MNYFKKKMLQIAGYFFYNKIKVFQPELFFKGKVVSIVGPAADLSGKALGKRIDEADIVVKFNRMVEFDHVVEADYGRRCDVVFHGLQPGDRVGRCGEIKPLSWKKGLVRTVVYPYFLGGRSYLALGYYFFKGGGFVDTYKISRNVYKNLENELSARPSSGVSAINLAVQGGAKKINVYGFSFFKSGHNPAYFNTESEVFVDAKRFLHSPEAEFVFVDKLKKINSATLDFVYPNPFNETWKNRCRC